jgi:putative hydrolase of the HAD superfamily
VTAESTPVAPARAVLFEFARTLFAEGSGGEEDVWIPHRDVAAVLARIRRSGSRIAVVSNVSHDIRPLMREHRLDTYIDAYVLSFEVGVAKPDPAIFQIACDRLGVRPGECLMVGDDPHADGGAADAGLATLILPHTVSPDADRLQPLIWMARLLSAS